MQRFDCESCTLPLTHTRSMPLAIEDVFTAQQRSKVDAYPGSGDVLERGLVVAKSREVVLNDH